MPKRKLFHWSVVLMIYMVIPSQRGWAKDGGIRIDAGPSVSYSRYSDGSSQGWSGAAYLGVDAWAGPFGALLQATKGTRISQVTFTNGTLTSTMTLTTQVDVAPSFNITPGPLHLRLAVGPWFSKSEARTESVSHADLSSYWADWSGIRFMGAMAEARLDANLPILSPFAILSVHSQHSLPVMDPTQGEDPGAYSARDVRATAGIRVNLVPIVKLTVAGFAGQSQHVLQTDLSSGTQTWEVLGETYGVSVWATLKL